MFASKDTYGICAAAYMHAEARKTGKSISVTFCDGDAADDLLRLIQAIKLAQSKDIEMPGKRTIVFANVSIEEYALTELICSKSKT